MTKAQGRRSSKHAKYHELQFVVTKSNKERKRKNWLKKKNRLANPTRVAIMVSNRADRYAASRARRGKKPLD
jgi:hypothetical protein